MLDTRGRVVRGFYAAGDSTGGLFYDNYPGGTGLTNAAVYGKITAESADQRSGEARDLRAEPTDPDRLTRLIEEVREKRCRRRVVRAAHQSDERHPADDEQSRR